jgi:hypothetical protein
MGEIAMLCGSSKIVRGLTLFARSSQEETSQEMDRRHEQSSSAPGFVAYPCCCHMASLFFFHGRALC